MVTILMEFGKTTYLLKEKLNVLKVEKFILVKNIKLKNMEQED